MGNQFIFSLSYEMCDVSKFLTKKTLFLAKVGESGILSMILVSKIHKIIFVMLP